MSSSDWRSRAASVTTMSRVELGVPVHDVGEGGTADEGELAVADRLDGGRARQAVDHGDFADQLARSEHGQDALLAVGRGDRHGEHAASQPVAAVAGVAALEQRLALAQGDGPLAGQQPAGQLGRQPAQHVVRRIRSVVVSKEVRLSPFSVRTEAVRRNKKAAGM